MEEKTDSAFSLDKIDFIIRNWEIILSSFLIIFNIFLAFSANMPKQYKTKAIILFESPPGAGAKKDAVNEKKDAAEKLLAGSNIEPVLEEVLKNTPPAERAHEYKHLKATLLNIKTGRKFSWESKGTGYVLDIGFSYTNPSYCYKTVKVTMDMVIKEIQQKFTREIEANVTFLKDQLKFYKDKLDANDAEMEGLAKQLLSRHAGLSEQEKKLVLSVVDVKDISKDDPDKSRETAEEKIARIETDLLELRDRRASLQASLKDGTFVAQSILTDLDEEDLFLKEYKKTIAVKEMEIDSLMARGYKGEHPQVKQLRQEVDRAKEIRRTRMARLKPGGPGSPEYEEAKERVGLEINELDLKIALIENSLKKRNARDKPAVTQPDRPAITAGDTKEAISRLASLQRDRAVDEGYYLEMRKNLVSAELKYRAETGEAGFIISIVQAPEVSIKPDSSMAQRATFRGFIISILISLSLGSLVNMLKDRIYSEREAAELLGIPVIATIDSIATKSEIASRDRRFMYGGIATVIVMVVSRIMIGIFFSSRG